MSSTKTTSPDESFDLLSNHRRRYALHACKQTGAAIETSELADRVAAWEYDKSPESVTTDERRRVYTSIQQTHLPALEDAGLVERNGKRVETTERAAGLDGYTDLVFGRSIPWERCYLGLSVAAGVVVAGAHAGGDSKRTPGLAWAWLIVLLFFGTAAYHVRRSRRGRLGGEGPPPEIER